MRTPRRCLAIIIIALLIGGTHPPQARAAEQCFTETGFCISGRFLDYWLANGGLARNGYPLSAERRETLEDGKEYTVQYFERVRMEYHPENPAPHDVLLGQFGRRVLYSRRTTGISLPATPLPGRVFFPETGHNLSEGFLRYWQANGGLAQFGYPLTEEFIETLEDGRDYTVQYFERARFEYHPENAPPYDILLGQFGRQVLAENALVAEPFRYWFVALQQQATPLGPATITAASYQPFERGAMLYRADTREIYLFFSGTSEPSSCYRVADTWDPSQPIGGGPGPSPGLYEPKRGFGKVWTDGTRQLLGYATTPEETGYTMTTQEFSTPGARPRFINLFSRPDGVSAHAITSGGSSAPSCSVIALR